MPIAHPCNPKLVSLSAVLSLACETPRPARLSLLTPCYIG